MTSTKDPTPEASRTSPSDNVETRAAAAPGGEGSRPAAATDPEAQAEAILAESEERTLNADPDDAQGGHRQSSDTADR